MTIAATPEVTDCTLCPVAAAAVGRLSLSGCALRTQVFEAPPTVILTAGPGPGGKGTRMTGLTGRFLDVLADVLNCTFALQLRRTTTFASVVEFDGVMLPGQLGATVLVQPRSPNFNYL